MGKPYKKDIENWQRLIGSADFELKDGVIIGTAVLGSSGNSIFCTKEK